VTVFIDLFRRCRPGNRFGAGLRGLLVGALLLAVSQTAGRSKTHAAAAPGEISITHI
jgi:hypothetical protein